MKSKATASEQTARPSTHRIMDLCDYLSIQVLQPMLERNGAKWDPRFINFFKLDNTCNPLEPTGTVRLAVPPLLAGQAGQLEQALAQALAHLGIKTGPFQYERHPVNQAVQEITIPITENPATAKPADLGVPGRKISSHHRKEKSAALAPSL